MSKKVTTEEFINKANIKHNYLYKYDKVEYINTKTEVIIYCLEHGYFNQTPNNHLNGAGCYKCGKMKMAINQTMTKEIFLQKAQEVHGNKYDYSLVEFNSAVDYITIICRQHGIFIKRCNVHYKGGGGCDSCRKIEKPHPNKSNIDEFILKANLKHKERYSYDKTVYAGKGEHLIVTCKEHGDFNVTPNNHLKGSGCPKCASYSWGYKKENFVNASKGKNCILYILKLYNQDEEFIKVGITTKTVEDRFRNKKLPYEYEIIYLIEGNAEYVYTLEKKLLRENHLYKYLPKLKFAGENECFILDAINTIKI